jgi:hypothetical protein
MTIPDIVLQPSNTIYLAALGILLAITVVEIITVLMGWSMSDFIEIDVDFGGVDTTGFFGNVLAWMRIGQVPVIVSLLAFLAGFGSGGIVLVSVVRDAQSTIGWLVSLPVTQLIGVLALVVGVVVMGLMNRLVYLIIPKDVETYVTKIEELVGHRAVVLTGNPALGLPVQARVVDIHKQAHYVRVEPSDHISFQTGDTVQLTHHLGSDLFRADVLNLNK